MTALTPKQAECLEAIRDLIEIGNGVSPTCGEIAQHLKIGRTSAFQRIVGLEERGAIRRAPGKHRIIEIVDDRTNVIGLMGPMLRAKIERQALLRVTSPNAVIIEICEKHFGLAS